MSMSDSPTAAQAQKRDEKDIDEMSREEMKDRLLTLEEEVNFFKEQLWDLEEIVTGDYGVVGGLRESDQKGSVLDRLEEDSSGSSKLTGNRDRMLPGHRMYGDLRTGAGSTMNDTQKRAARIFGLFVERVVESEPNKVDPSGQQYTIKSGEVQEALLGGEDEENLLEGVKKKSWSQTSARVMRDVARASKWDDCECEEIDDCTHAKIRFHPGRPHTLATPKKLFHRVMEDVYGDDVDATDDEDEQSSEASSPTDSNGGDNA